MENAIDTCHCLAARRGARNISRLYDAHLAASGLSVSQFSILSAIGLNPGIRAADLGVLMVMERTTLLRNLRPLQEAGWVESQRAEGERAHVFALTEAGLARLRGALPLWQAAQAAFEAEFGADQAARLRAGNLALGAAPLT